MKPEAAIRPDRPMPNVARRSPAQVPASRTVLILPLRNRFERQPCELEARTRLRHEVQARCSRMLTIAGIGILLYSASMLLHPACGISLPRTAALPASTPRPDLSRENGESLP